LCSLMSCCASALRGLVLNNVSTGALGVSAFPA
jgi:hypothetical protein